MNKRPPPLPQPARPASSLLILLLPGFISLIVTAVVSLLGDFSTEQEGTAASISLFVGAVLCLPIGLWSSGAFRHFGLREVSLGLVMFLVLLVVNGAIAFAGCVAFMPRR